MGHPAPFNLKMIGVGNEQWGPQYIERYQVFAKAIHEKYPAIKIVSSAGPGPTGKNFEYASTELKKLNAQIVDEHYYANPDWFLKNADRYDNYDRNSYKIFAGEYAAHGTKTGIPELRWRSFFTVSSPPMPSCIVISKIAAIKGLPDFSDLRNKSRASSPLQALSTL